ncbi:nitronate monooxygenase [Nocardia sp. NPDC051030]|uniref:NAD(P)H-dependent flavin oxidoreductase n=1 Tax=Nocardia sp. NPDC051030 TaxID=3155162 RepID=UPI003448AD2E
MVLRTAFTERMSIRHPIALAPMGGSAGGRMAAAVSGGGGLGLIGAARGDREWMEREVAIARAATTAPWGIGLWTWGIDQEVVDRALAFRPDAVLLSFGDPTPYAESIRAAGAKLLLQVSEVDEARRAVDAGADVIIAQGGDHGGHGGRNPIGTMSFVPAVVDVAGETPVLAAGGIVDGRGLAAALALGAAGVLMGTRFQASPEAILEPESVKALLAARSGDTDRNRVLDIARGAAWPDLYPARTLRNEFLDDWRGREDELRADDEAKQKYREAAARGDMGVIPVWAGQGVELIRSVESAADLVTTIVAEAERAVARIGVRDS